MRNWWPRLGCFLTGWNFRILNSCTEASRKQLKKYTSALLILIILWAFIGFSFAERYVQAPISVCCAVAAIFVVIIIQIERQIILTVGSTTLLGIFRFVIAIIMALLGSAILDQIIFKDDIEKKMIQIVDRQVNEQLPSRLVIIDKKLQELQVEIDSLDKRNLSLYEEISKRPSIPTYRSIIRDVPVKQPDGTTLFVQQRESSNSPVPNPKIREAETNNQHLDDLRKQKEEYSQKKLMTESSLRDELKSKQGFLEELNAIIEILRERNIALFFYLLLFGFLMFLELFVVVAKAIDRKSDYDLVIEHQLKQKQKTLNYLTKNSE